MAFELLLLVLFISNVAAKFYLLETEGEYVFLKYTLINYVFLVNVFSLEKVFPVLIIYLIFNFCLDSDPKQIIPYLVLGKSSGFRFTTPTRPLQKSHFTWPNFILWFLQ